MRAFSVTILLGLALVGDLRAQEASFRAGFVDDFAVLGEAADFVLLISLDRSIEAAGDPAFSRPDLPAIAGLVGEYVGGNFQQTGQKLQIINGRRRGTTTWTGRYLWKFRAEEEGSYRMPAFEVELDGRKIRVVPEKALLRVGREAPGNRWVGVAVAVDRLDPYVNQPVRLRWVLSSERIIVQTNESIPELDIAWAGSPPGFLAKPAVTAGRRDRNALTVTLGQERLRLPVEVKDDRNPPVIEMTLDKTLIPLAAGTIDLGGTRASLEVAQSSRSVAFGGTEYQGRTKAFVRTEPIVLEVRDAPLAGRPESYRGAIGDFDVRVSYGDGKIRAGDGVTLNIRLEGSEVVDLIEAPDIAADFTDCRALFSGKESAGEGADRRVTFSWLIKPLDHRMTELPDFSYSWFRPESETFATANTGVLPLEITGELEEGEVFGGSERAERRAIAVLGEGLRPLVAEPGRMRPLRRTIATGWFFLVLIGPLLSLAATAILLRRRRELSGDVALQRRRKASKEAQARLNEARALLGQKGFHGKLSRCLSGFVADKLGLPPASVSAANLRDLLARAEAPRALADETADLLDELDHAAFGGRAGDEGETLARAEEMLARLDREIRS